MFYESIFTSSSDRKHNNMHRLNTISDVFEHRVTRVVC